MYLDPGFGSLIIQLIVGGLAVIGGVFFMFRRKITSFFSKNKKGESQVSVADDAEGAESSEE